MQAYGDPGQLAESTQQLLLRMADYTRQTVELTRQELHVVVMNQLKLAASNVRCATQSRMLEEQSLMLHKLEVVLSDMQRDQAAAMLTFEQRHWAALLANERRIMEKIEEGNVQVVAALALKLDTLQGQRREEAAAARQIESLASNANFPLPASGPLHGDARATGLTRPSQTADPSQQPCQLDNGDEKQQVEALMREIKSGVVDDDDPDAARRAKQRGMQQAAAAKSDAVLDLEHDGLREAVQGLQLGEATSEQGSTAGTAPARQPEDVPPLRSSLAGIKREDLLSSVPDDIKSSVPKDTIEGVQALQEHETNDILKVVRDTYSGSGSSGRPQRASAQGGSPRQTARPRQRGGSATNGAGGDGRAAPGTGGAQNPGADTTGGEQGGVTAGRAAASSQNMNQRNTYHSSESGGSSRSMSPPLPHDEQSPHGADASHSSNDEEVSSQRSGQADEHGQQVLSG